MPQSPYRSHMEKHIIDVAMSGKELDEKGEI